VESSDSANRGLNKQWVIIATPPHMCTYAHQRRWPRHLKDIAAASCSLSCSPSNHMVAIQALDKLTRSQGQKR
jgi:hypothetical protein